MISRLIGALKRATGYEDNDGPQQIETRDGPPLETIEFDPRRLLPDLLERLQNESQIAGLWRGLYVCFNLERLPAHLHSLASSRGVSTEELFVCGRGYSGGKDRYYDRTTGTLIDEEQAELTADTREKTSSWLRAAHG